MLIRYEYVIWIFVFLFVFFLMFYLIIDDYFCNWRYCDFFLGKNWYYLFVLYMKVVNFFDEKKKWFYLCKFDYKMIFFVNLMLEFYFFFEILY